MNAKSSQLYLWLKTIRLSHVPGCWQLYDHMGQPFEIVAHAWRSQTLTKWFGWTTKALVNLSFVWNLKDETLTVVMASYYAYVHKLSDGLSRVFRWHGITFHHTPGNTLRQLLVTPKDPTSKEQICGPVYYIKCDGGKEGEHCNENYIGETERTLKSRVSEHHKPSCSLWSEVSHHLFREHPDRGFQMVNVNIIGCESDWFRRGVKEANYIRQLRLLLNRDGGVFI